MLIGHLGTGGFFLSSLSSACLAVGEKDSDLSSSGYNTYLEIIHGWKGSSLVKKKRKEKKEKREKNKKKFVYSETKSFLSPRHGLSGYRYA